MSTEPTNDKETRAEFFNRAGKSQEEFRKLVTSMSVATLGVFFVTLTGERSASLSEEQSIRLVYAIILMSLATFFGVIAWRAAGTDFHDKAKHGPSSKKTAHCVKKICDWCLLLFFILGIFASAFYIAQSIKPPSVNRTLRDEVKTQHGGPSP